MARFPSERFRKTVGNSGEVVALVEVVRNGEVIASSAAGDFVVEDGTVTFDLGRAIKTDLSLTLLIEN